MKTIFQTGLPRNGGVWLGQSAQPGQSLNIDTLLQKLNNADNQSSAIQTYLSDPRAQNALLSDYGRLTQGMNDVANNLANDITRIEQALASGYGPTGTSNISTDDVATIDNYVNVMNQLYAIIQAHPLTGGGVSTAAIPAPVYASSQAATRPVAIPGAPAAPGARPTNVAQVVPAPGMSPLMLGGIAAAGIVVLALVLKKK